MSLLSEVAELLEQAEVSCCLIGAAAMAAHGVPRSTLDLDLLTTDRRVLDRSLWEALRDDDVEVRIRPGDLHDPLAGVVRLTASDERAVDVIVGRFSWQAEIVSRARPVSLPEVELAVAEPADLILLKLYAGGPQDRWDIQQILLAQGLNELRQSVEDQLAGLPTECVALWRELASP